jgi:predicted flap endonuclease-1-like 5' DNA nuclease
VNGLSLLLLIAAAIVVAIAYRLGRVHARRDGVPPGASSSAGPAAIASGMPAQPQVTPAQPHGELPVDARDARLVQLEQFAEDRRSLFREVAQARTQVARYRQIIVDIENNAPPPILGERGAPDDLKLIVGIGPVLERLLQQLGIATYRQIARWTEHDIDQMDARLAEFPGRIRRDAWVTQARALHQSKYGEQA